jgi:hypothetical protein
MLGLWDERAAGTPGEGAPVGVQFTLMHLPNRRIRDPYVRWCGRGEAVRPLPIPIRLPLPYRRRSSYVTREQSSHPTFYQGDVA